MTLRQSLLSMFLVLQLSTPVETFAQSGTPAGEVSPKWDVTQPRGKTRTIDFTSSEGTWMSVDISPDGQWIVFDLLAHIYRMPAKGGEARCLTQDSGIALNYHPRYSPDGSSIAFVSDRGGQTNLWIMNADGSSPRPVFNDGDVTVAEPVWSPDGRFIFVRRQQATDHSEFEVDRLWMYPREGGIGIEVARFERGGAGWPSVSPDGRFLYFHVCHKAGPRDNYGCEDIVRGASQVQRLELATGQIVDVTAGAGGAVAPEISPDGRWLAFARRIPDGTISHKGHTFGPRTALFLRNLSTGAERVVMDPIETDLAERQHDIRPIFFMVRMLPGYVWVRDSQSILISQGGKIRRLWVDTGRVETIPFTARVHREISGRAYSALRINDDPLTVRFFRWHTASPDGRRVVFQAIGKIWIVDTVGGVPRRLTEDTFRPFEFAPAWSPDGRWVAFTSWDDAAHGHLWKIPAAGGKPVQLTQQAGEYTHPVWSPDGRQIVVSRGSGATARGDTWAGNLSYALVRVPSEGGPAADIVEVNRGYRFNRGQIVRASFGPQGRVFFLQQARKQDAAGEEPRTSPVVRAPVVSQLVSVRPDGSDRQVHLQLPYADEAAVSPDGTWVAFQEGDNVYLTAFPQFSVGTDGTQPIYLDKRDSHFAVKQLSRRGGVFPRWRSATVVEFGHANHYYAYDLVSARLEDVDILLTVPRAIQKGTVALTGAHILTFGKQGNIEKGSVIVQNGRIVCVGNCNTSGVGRVLDVSGKTIIPGFIDMHAHNHYYHQGIFPQYNFESAAYLAYGITTTLDPAAWTQNAFSTAELIEAGAMLGPRTFTTADPLYGGDSSRQNAITSYEVAEENVDRLASSGAVTIKQYLQPRRNQRQWIIDAARRRGLRVTGEINDHEYNLSMIMDGQTGFEHPMPYLILYEDVAKFYGQAQTFYSPTFVVGGVTSWSEDFFFQESEVWKQEKQRRFLPWSMVVPHARRRMLRPVTDYSFPFIAQGLADIIAQGGYGAIGGHGEQHGIGSHWEIWMAASAIGPQKALEVASLHGAQFLGAEQDLGSIAVGKFADLLVLNSNPLDNIRNTTDLLYVMKAGFLYEAATLDQIWPERKLFGEYYWVDKLMLQTDDRPINYWDTDKP